MNKTTYYRFPSNSLNAINQLHLQWFGVPSPSGFMVEIGGLQFTAAPFSGWWTSPEIVQSMSEYARYPNVMRVSIYINLF